MKESIYEGDYNDEDVEKIVENLNVVYVGLSGGSEKVIVIGKGGNSGYGCGIIECVVEKVGSGVEGNDVKMELRGIGCDGKRDEICLWYNEIYVGDCWKK